MSYQGDKFEEIADAIRYMDKTTAPIVANTFKDRIRAIPLAVEKPHNIRYFDFDGTLLKNDWIQTGSNSILPITSPSHEFLDFVGWTHAQEKLNNIQYRPSERGETFMPGHIDVGAIYRCVDNISHIWVKPNLGGGMIVAPFFAKAVTNATITIQWGDETQETFTLSAATALKSHTYAIPGEYRIDISSQDDVVYGLGNGATSTQVVSTGYQLVTKAYIADNVILKGYSFYNMDNLEKVVLPQQGSTVNLSTSMFSGCRGLKHLTIPKGYTTIPVDFLKNCSSLASIVLSPDITTLQNGAFYLTAILGRLVLPSGIDTIPNAFFDLGSAKEIVSDVIRTMGTNALNSYFLLEKMNLAKKVNFGGGSSAINSIYNLELVNLEINLTATSTALTWGQKIYGTLIIGSNSGVTACPGINNFNNISNLILRENWASIAAAISNLGLTSYVSLATTPPTISNSAFVSGLSKVSTWYVPDASVTVYKTATNWASIANYIQPLSSAPSWLQQIIGDLQ